MSKNTIPYRPSAHRRHPAIAPRPLPTGIHSAELGTQLIIAGVSFAAIAGAAIYAFGSYLVG